MHTATATMSAPTRAEADDVREGYLPPGRQFFSVKEFAVYHGCAKRTAWRDIEKGAIPIAKRVGPGRRPRIARHVVETYGRPEA